LGCSIASSANAAPFNRIPATTAVIANFILPDLNHLPDGHASMILSSRTVKDHLVNPCHFVANPRQRLNFNGRAQGRDQRPGLAAGDARGAPPAQRCRRSDFERVALLLAVQEKAGAALDALARAARDELIRLNENAQANARPAAA
jgi:hypothetical protein